MTDRTIRVELTQFLRSPLSDPNAITRLSAVIDLTDPRLKARIHSLRSQYPRGLPHFVIIQEYENAVAASYPAPSLGSETATPFQYLELSQLQYNSNNSDTAFIACISPEAYQFLSRSHGSIKIPGGDNKGTFIEIHNPQSAPRALLDGTNAPKCYQLGIGIPFTLGLTINLDLIGNVFHSLFEYAPPSSRIDLVPESVVIIPKPVYLASTTDNAGPSYHLIIIPTPNPEAIFHASGQHQWRNQSDSIVVGPVRISPFTPEPGTRVDLCNPNIKQIVRWCIDHRRTIPECLAANPTWTRPLPPSLPKLNAPPPAHPDLLSWCRRSQSQL